MEKDTSVTSRPARAMRALPMGIRNSSSDGTSPVLPYKISFSRNTTGLLSRMALLSRPLASAGVEGATTLRPGTAEYHAV